MHFLNGVWRGLTTVGDAILSSVSTPIGRAVGSAASYIGEEAEDRGISLETVSLSGIDAFYFGLDAAEEDLSECSSDVNRATSLDTYEERSSALNGCLVSAIERRDADRLQNQSRIYK